MRHKSESLLDVCEKASQLSPFSVRRRAAAAVVFVISGRVSFGHSSFFVWSDMDFGGFQKLSLLNYPDTVACAVFTAGCNFRCPYCHNAGLVSGDCRPVSEETVIDHLKKRRGLVEGICVSGGEPLMHAEIMPFLREMKKMGFLVKVDTNGSFPERLESIIAEGLADYIAMDVKNTAEKYAETIGLENAPIDLVRQSILLLRSGSTAYEFRTTVAAEFHTAADIEKIAAALKGASVWYLQPFRDSPEVPRKGLHAPDPETMKAFGSIGNRYLKTIIRD